MEPKALEDIYKSHLDNNSRSAFGGGQVDSARQNLASSFVNGLVNAAFGQDKLLMEDGNKWLYKNKEHGMLGATASLRLACDKVTTGVRNECDPALALLSDYVLLSSNVMRIGAILGLGLAYAGSNRDHVLSLLPPVLVLQTMHTCKWLLAMPRGLSVSPWLVFTHVQTERKIFPNMLHTFRTMKLELKRLMTKCHYF